MTTTTFDLREVVDHVLATTTEPDPHVLVALVLPLIPDDALRGVVGELLPWVIRERIRAARNTPAPATGSRRWDAAGAATNDPHSWREYVGPNDWRLLAALTVDNIRSIAECYHRRAAGNADKAKRYEMLAERMETDGATVVGDLPAEVIREILS